MPIARFAAAGALVLVAGACATKGQVRRVETELVVLRTQMARQDSARAAELGRIMALQGRILDSIQSTQASVRQVRTETGAELLNLQAQLVQIQELTGMSQRRLGEIRRQLDDRMMQFGQDTLLPPAGDTTAPPPPSVATPDQLYQTSLQLLQRGSASTARSGFQEFLRSYPTHALVPDALYWIGGSFEGERADSALAYYRLLASRHPTSTRTPDALYKTGLLLLQQGDREGARAAFERVVREYPRADVAGRARDRLAELRP